MNSLGKIWEVLTSLLVIGGLCFSNATLARSRSASQPIYGPDNLAAVINQIVSQAGVGTAIGVEIKSMKYGDNLYSLNDQRLFTPASTLKIFTAEAALIYLGPQYKFPTRLLTDATQTSNGIINGNVYLVHSGDPSLTYYDLTGLMSRMLRSQQIQGVTGNLYLDNTAYDQENLGPGWVWKDRNYCYAAPINASIINHNCLSLRIQPAKTPGKIANIVPNEKYYYGGIANTVVTKPSWAKSCSIRLNKDADSSITLSGCMKKGNNARGASVVISNIVQYNKSLLQNLFRRFGIQVGGKVGTKAAPPNLTELATHESKPLTQLVTEMLKKSDNVIAGSLFKKMGELYYKQPGSWENGSNAVTQILATNASMSTSKINVLDGSGLSRYNQVTPSQMMQVLDYAFHNPATSYEFISALPIAGVDGTLKHRLYNVAGKVRAKTGTMAGVVSLAGYAMSKNKEPIAFVIILNGKNNVWKYREIEDRIVTALTNYTR